MPSVQLSRIFSYVTFRNMRFLILDCPSNENLPIYLEEFTAHNIVDVVRVCEPSYDIDSLKQHNINVHDWHFQDGTVPPPEIIQNWLNLVEERFGQIHCNKKFDMKTAIKSNDDYIAGPHHDPTIAIHCVAGLGRAPALVAIALIESGMESLDAVTYIRRYRRGAFNSKQIAYLDSYKRGQYNKKTSVLASIILKKNKSSNNTNGINGNSNGNGKQSSGNFLSVKPATSSFNIRKRSPSSKSVSNLSKASSSSCSNISGQHSNDNSAPPSSSSNTNRTSILFNFNKIFKSKSSSSTNSSKNSAEFPSNENVNVVPETDSTKLSKKKKYNLYM
ncbi:phosphatases II [Anaeromyces robustus]|uniref:protein-tyrosine-phosphatase n=1 Tax=Anaeromyces robustus TaxID=1754192 RepID=A0A1Y1XID8_9FUNG|nr:phosphatases II [Anaeromyces robustus]|eukprot:ORX85528.1 phosphatases II [Anaeromyces robustus]